MSEIKWIPGDSGERPEELVPVLVLYEDGSRGISYLNEFFFFRLWREDTVGDYRSLFEPRTTVITHWAHLPEPPIPWEKYLRTMFRIEPPKEGE